MGSFLSVAQGSDQPPTFVEMRLKSSKKTGNPPVVLVGKGVCFDRYRTFLALTFMTRPITVLAVVSR